jgi:hypothetical protein
VFNRMEVIYRFFHMKRLLILSPLFLFNCISIINESSCTTSFYLANQSTRRILAKPIVRDSLEPATSWTDIPSGDTGRIYSIASSQENLSPAQTFSEILIRITDTGDTTNIADTIKPVYDSLWTRSDGRSTNAGEVSWLFLYK